MVHLVQAFIQKAQINSIKRMAVAAAEGSSNPYWSDPSEEGPRIERLLSILKRQPDANRIAFFVGKSNNDNFVAYKWDGDRSSIEPFWISTVNVPAERRDPLNLAESMLYGCDLDSKWNLTLRAEAVNSRVMQLSLDDNDVPAVVGVINNTMCVFEYAYVQMNRGLLPDVDYVRIVGRSVADGTVVTEVMKKPM